MALAAGGYKRPDHANIVALLGSMDASWLLDRRCYFGGGTAIVLANGEYRRSLDVAFLCDHVDGYREIRTAVAERGVHALFGEGATSPREFRIDQYGVRGVVVWNGQAIKVEVIREARMSLTGSIGPLLPVPTLSLEDQVAEKLLANADRGLDRSAGYRDLIDPGVLVAKEGLLPPASIAKAELAYGADVARKVQRVLEALAGERELRHAAETLDMDEDVARHAVGSLRAAALRAWPKLDFAAGASGEIT